jgi:hypothetical protein
MTAVTQQLAFIQLSDQDFPPAVQVARYGEQLGGRILMVELQVFGRLTPHASATQICDTALLALLDPSSRPGIALLKLLRGVLADGHTL